MFAWRGDPADCGGLGVAFTDRVGGGERGFTFGNCDDLSVLRADMAALRDALGLSDVVLVHQVHGADVLVVDGAMAHQVTDDAWLGDAVPGQASLPVADAVVTRQPGVALAVRVADCVPVALADSQAGVVGVAHAGRVGLLAGVLPATVAALVRLGARPECLRAWIGPHACGDCYEVPESMAREAESVLPGVAAQTSWGTPSLDLGGAAERQLTGLGVHDILRCDPCTMTTPTLFSHRHDGAGTGRQLGLVWLVG